MKLLQQSAALREKLDRVRTLEANGHVIRTWQPLLQDLPNHLARLERLVAVIRRMQRYDLLPVGQSLAPKGTNALVAKELPELRDKLVSKPEKVMQQSGWAKANATLKGASDALEKSVDEIWINYLKKIAPKLDDWLPFFQSGRFGSEITKIASLHKELDALAQNLPADDEAFERATAKSREIHRLVKKLDFGDIPPEVKRFIEQVANPGGVALGELNEQVLAWLRDKKLLQAFRVNMGGR